MGLGIGLAEERHRAVPDSLALQYQFVRIRLLGAELFLAHGRIGDAAQTLEEAERVLADHERRSDRSRPILLERARLHVACGDLALAQRDLESAKYSWRAALGAVPSIDISREEQAIRAAALARLKREGMVDGIERRELEALVVDLCAVDIVRTGRTLRGLGAAIRVYRSLGDAQSEHSTVTRLRHFVAECGVLDRMRAILGVTRDR